MTLLTITELNDKLQQFKNIELQLEGIVTANLKIEILKIQITNNYIEIYTREIDKIKFNIHQIMKIEMEQTNIIKIEFDNLQIVRVILKK